MAQSYNIFSRTNRNGDYGALLKEVLSGATGSVEVPKYSLVRVRATGATTVTIDGVLAITMMAGEIVHLNAGPGLNSDAKETVTVTIGAAAAFVQVSIEQQKQYQP